MTRRAEDALLLEVFGATLLSYVANVATERLEQRLQDGVLLEESAETALGQLVPLAERVAQQQVEHPGMPASHLVDALSTVQSDADQSIGNLLRLLAGGDVPPVPDDGDELIRVACRLARDAYPQLLVPAEEPWHHPHLMFFRHPARDELQEALLSDDVGRLYPEEDPGLGRRGTFFNSLGRGGGGQSVMFGETIVSSAWDLALMSKPRPDLADLYVAVRDSIHALRAAARGELPEVRALLAFTGITTDEVVGTPWGPLRPITEEERSTAPKMLEGQVSGTGPDGKSVTVSYAGELVLDTRLPFGIVVTEPTSPDSFPDFPAVRGSGVLRRRTESVQLAVFLAIDRPEGQWATARFAWQWVADPSSQGRSIGWADTKSSPGFMPHELDAVECAELGTWCDIVDAHWQSNIDIAVRRALSAAQSRNDGADRLVDAVISWENLFGTSEGEPRLRISSAMAWLLGSNAAERSELQRGIKQLYDDRSKIVHGASVNELAIAEKANRALDLTRKCLQRLFRDRSDLLALPDGAARSLALVLDC